MTDEVEVNAAEVEAREFGWVPVDEFKGNTDEWRDAETFLRRGKEINGFLRKDLQKVQDRLSAKDRELAEIKSTLQEFNKYHQETETRAYKKALDELKQDKMEAIAQGDGQRVIAIEETIEALKETKQSQEAPKKQEAPVYNKEFFEWAKENTWYSTNPELKSLAELIGQEIGLQEPDLQGSAFLSEVTKRVKETYPEKFSNPARTQANVLTSTDSRLPGIRTKKSYNELPPEAKSACDKFVKQGLLTVDQYLKEYDWE